MTQTKRKKTDQSIGDEESQKAPPSVSNGDDLIRYQIRPMPDTGWNELVSEMQDYVTIQHGLINFSLERNQNIGSKFVAAKKRGRSIAQTKIGVVLRTDILALPPVPEEHINLEEFYRNGRIKRKNNKVSLC